MNKSLGWNLNKIIKGLYHRYPCFFEKGRLELCSKVFYPIALLELEVLESVSEEFDTIEYSILSLYYAGLTNAEEICDVLGLPLNYTHKLLDFLESYGHINLQSKETTPLGMKSVEDEVKYTKMLVRQRVQVDTLSGQLLPKERIQKVNLMFHADETNSRIPHVAPHPYVDEEMLLQMNQVLPRYKFSNDSIFHINVEQIEGIVSKEILFTKAVLLKFSHLPHPVILIQCRNNTKDQQYEWLPISLSESNAQLLNLNNDLPIVDDEVVQPLTEITNMLTVSLERLTRNEQDYSKFVTQIEKNFEGLVNQDSLSIEKLKFHIKLNPTSFKKWNRTIFSIIESLAYQSRNVPYVGLEKTDYYPGVVFQISSNQTSLNELSEQLFQLSTVVQSDFDVYHSLNDNINFQASKEITIDQLLQALHGISTTNTEAQNI